MDITVNKFNQEIEKLLELQPITIWQQIVRTITDLTVSKSKIAARNEEVFKKIREITSLAETILQEMPEDFRDFETLRKKLEDDSDFPMESDNKIPLSNEDLKKFHQGMDLLFNQIYPIVKKGTFHLDKDQSGQVKMPKIIQDYLSPKIKRLREEKRNDISKAIDQNHRIQRKIAKGNLAMALGQDGKRGHGSTGTLIIKDINGKPVGVYKVGKKDTPLITRLKNFIKSLFGGQLAYLSKSDLAQPLSERAAYCVSNELGFDIIPPSFKTRLIGASGVFQIFIRHQKPGILDEVKAAQLQIDEHSKRPENPVLVKYPKNKGPNDYLIAKEMIGNVDVKVSFTKEEKTIFQKFAIFDFLIGNLDRHEENWLITLSKDNELTHIKAIDNANAFPKRQPAKGSLATRNQYKWKILNLAKEFFTSEIIQFVKERLSPEKIDLMIANLKKDLPEFLDADMERLLIKRAKVIFNFIQTNHTPALLAEYSTEEDMDEFLLLC